jgi:hypothetical protein
VTVTVFQTKRDGKWHVASTNVNRSRCRRNADTKAVGFRAMTADDGNDQIDWCRDCDARGDTPDRARRRMARLVARQNPDEIGLTREMLLATVYRALQASFPERADILIRALERRLIELPEEKADGQVAS